MRHFYSYTLDRNQFHPMMNDSEDVYIKLCDELNYLEKIGFKIFQILTTGSGRPAAIIGYREEG